jgi:hypothetical protein
MGVSASSHGRSIPARTGCGTITASNVSWMDADRTRNCKSAFRSAPAGAFFRARRLIVAAPEIADYLPACPSKSLVLTESPQVFGLPAILLQGGDRLGKIVVRTEQV